MNSLRKTIMNRALFLLVVLGIVFLIITAKLGYVMIINPIESSSESFISESGEQIEQPRGKIVDARGNVLAISIQRKSLYANPREIKKPWATARRLATLIDRTAPDIYKRLTRDRYFIWLKRKLEPSLVRRIEDEDLPGIGFMPEYERVYPQTMTKLGVHDTDTLQTWGLGAHVLGFVGVDNQGLEGVEKQYNNFLSKVGEMSLEPGVDHQQNVSAPKLELTIDQTIQYIVEDELSAMAQKEKPRNAMAVVMDPSTGYILAMANFPSFNGNQFENATEFERKNRAITDSFEPGSTLKVMTLASGLTEEAFESDDSYHCQGFTYISKADHTLKCYADHGNLAVPEILIESCNVGTVKAVGELKDDVLFEYLREFGFGNWTGIRLPGEAKGSLRRPYRWSALSKPSLAIGQGISTTAIQLLTAFSSVVNNGTLIRPRLVKRKVMLNGEVEEFEPVPIREIIPKDIATKMKRYMERVVTEGTGKQGYSEKYRLGGKTGTAQKANLKDGGYYEDKVLVSFAGFGPVEKPRLSVAVIVDEPKVGRYGGSVAAPVFKRIMERSLQYLERNPL